MPRKEWKAVDPADGWIKIIRGRRPPSEQWPHLQKQVAGSGLDFKSVKGRWRSGAPTTQLPNNVRTPETAKAALGPEDVSVKAEFEAPLARAKVQFQGTTRVSPSPDVVVAEAKKKVFRLEKALEVFGDSTGPEVDFLKKALAKAHEAARERPLEVDQGVPGIHQSFGAAAREVGGRSTGRVVTVDRREVKIVTIGKSAIGSASAARTRSDRIGIAHPSSCARMRSVASCRHPSVTSGRTNLVLRKVPLVGQHSTSARRRARRRRVVKLSKLRVKKCVGVWGSRHHRVSGQTGGARSFQVGNSHRGCPHARACIEQSRQGGCETEVFGRQVNIAVHGGESSPLSGFGIILSTRVVRTVHSRYGLRGSRVGEASNPGPRAKRRRRVVALDTEIDPESTMLDDLEESQVASSLVVRPSRSSRRLVLIGGSQDTTVVAPSNVDLHPGPEVVVLSDGSSVAEDEEEHSPAVRVSMCQGVPGTRCAGVAVPGSVDDGLSDTESVDSDPDRADVLEGSVASGDEEVEVPVGEMVAPVRPSAAAQRAGFVLLDHWDLGETFAQRGCLMRSVPRFLWGSFRVAMKVALEEIMAGVSRRSEIQQVRGWKLLLLLPRMLLHRPPRGGQIGKSKLIERFDKFAARQWQDLLVARNQVAKALKFVQLGELSAGRQALEGAELALGTTPTLRALRNRPTTLLDAIPELPRDLTVFNLDELLFGKNVRSGRKGAAGGLSGMTHDHIRPLLESLKDLHLLYTVCDLFAKGQMPGEMVQAIKLGRMTALQKEGGGVRGIVAGEVIKRVTQQLGPVVKAATAHCRPDQDASALHMHFKL